MQILEIFEKKLRLKNYSENTIRTYESFVRKFIIDTGIKDPYQLTTKQMIDYLENYNYTSISQQNQMINALKQFYKRVLNKSNIHLDKIERPRKEKHLPQVIEKELLIKKLSKIENIKHKAILSLAFSVGLRVSEVCKLKITDIDSSRMLIYINEAKGNKDRIAPLSDYILNLLREYYKKYKPIEYLFNGQNSLKYSVRSCQNIFKKYIDKDKSFHKLRHSSLTAMLENKVDLRTIQKIAGHNSIKTTESYMHVSKELLSNVALPI